MYYYCINIHLTLTGTYLTVNICANILHRRRVIVFYSYMLLYLHMYRIPNEVHIFEEGALSESMEGLQMYETDVLNYLKDLTGDSGYIPGV